MGFVNLNKNCECQLAENFSSIFGLYPSRSFVQSLNRQFLVGFCRAVGVLLTSSFYFICF